MKLSELEKINILTDYSTGNYTYSELHRKYKRGKETIRQLCLSNGFKSKSFSEVGKKYTIDENYFDKDATIYLERKYNKFKIIRNDTSKTRPDFGFMATVPNLED